MGTNFIRTNLQIASVSTTRLITITTASAQLITAGSAAFQIMCQNNGPANVSIADSSISMGSGDVVFPYANREFLNIADGFNVYLRADSVATVVSWTEFYPA